MESRFPPPLFFGDAQPLSRNVSWQADTVLHPSWLELVSLADSDTIRVEAQGEVFRSRSGQAAYYVARLRSLKAAATYAYRAITNGKSSPWYQFSTQPASTDHVSFLYVGDVLDRIETLSAKEAAGTIEADEVIELNALKDVDAACEAYNGNYTDDEKFSWMSQLYQYYTNAVAGTSAQPVPGLMDMDPNYKNVGLDINSAVLDDGVAYLYFSQFALSPYLSDWSELGFFASASQAVLDQNQAIVDAWKNWFDQIQEMKKNGTLKGVIIDVRSNGGGFVNDFQFVLGALLPQDIQTGYSREKSGVGRYDYGPLLPDERPALSDPHETITEPIVVLTNCMSVSMSEMTAMGAKVVSNARVVGKRSWGATAALFDDPKYYSIAYAGCIGELQVTPVYVYLTMCASFSMDNKCYEGVGVEPDIEVDFDADLFRTTGCDTQLERALQYIETGN